MFLEKTSFCFNSILIVFPSINQKKKWKKRSNKNFEQTFAMFVFFLLFLKHMMMMMMMIPSYHHDFPLFSFVQIISISHPRHGKITGFWEQSFLQLLPYIPTVSFTDTVDILKTLQFVWRWKYYSHYSEKSSCSCSDG